MNRTDRGRPKPSLRCETMPTPGAAPRGGMAREPTGGVSWTDCASRSRRASRPPRTFRPRTRPPSRPGWRPRRSTLTPAARAAIDGHARLLLAWTERDQPDRHPRSGRGRRRPRRRQPDRPSGSCASAASTRFIDLGSGGGYPGLPLAAVLPAERALLLEPIAKKAAFLSVAVAATGLDPIVEAAAVRAEALATDPRHRGSLAGGHRARRGRPGRPGRAGVPAARSGRLPRRLETGRPRRPSWPPRNGRSTRSAAVRWSSSRSMSPASRGIDWWSPPRAGASRLVPRLTRRRGRS